jgi:hypothetical protein
VTALERRAGTLFEGLLADGMRRGKFQRMNPHLAGISMFGMCFVLTRWPDIYEQLSLPELTAQMQRLAAGALVRGKGAPRS